MLTNRKLPEFASSDWYTDPTDHRCPHDAWLETLEIREPAEGERKEKRQTAITVRLLGAYHDGHIVFRYAGVGRYSIASDSCERGLGDWSRDELLYSSEGLLVHRARFRVLRRTNGSSDCRARGGRSAYARRRSSSSRVPGGTAEGSPRVSLSNYLRVHGCRAMGRDNCSLQGSPGGETANKVLEPMLL